MEAKRETASASVRVLEKSSKCYVESSVIVPDKKPDILKVLQVDASSAVTGSTLQKGKLFVQGRVDVTVLYLPDGEEGGIRSICAKFDFDDVIEGAEIDENMHKSVVCDVDQVDINLINSRKIAVRAAVGIDAEVTAEREIEYISAIECDDAGAKFAEVGVSSTVAADSCEFLMKEQVALADGAANIAEILKTDVRIEDKEVRCVTNKVIVKGNICATVLYLDGNNAICHADAQLPFTEVFETGESCEEDCAQVTCTVIEKNCCPAMDSDGDMRVLDFEILVGVDMSVCREQTIRYLSDCYFFGAQTVCETKTARLEHTYRHARRTETVRENIAADSRLPRPAAVYNIAARPRILSAEQNGDNIDISARLDVAVLYLSDSSDSPVCCRKAELPVSCSVAAEAKARVYADAECEHISCTLTGNGDIELRAAVAFSVEERDFADVEMVASAEKGEKTGGSELIILFTSGGETLWDISKKYRVSCDEVAELNSIEPGAAIEAHRRLIIPSM